MPDARLKCVSCGTTFVWTEREQEEAAADAEAEGRPRAVERECKSCRPRQGQQRA